MFAKMEPCGCSKSAALGSRCIRSQQKTANRDCFLRLCANALIYLSSLGRPMLDLRGAPAVLPVWRAKHGSARFLLRESLQDDPGLRDAVRRCRDIRSARDKP
jgi:hypothetical protein